MKKKRAIKRVIANEIVEKLIEKYNYINASNSEFLYYVNVFWFFGSYIRDTETLHDIDIAISLESKYRHDMKLRDTLERERRINSGLSFRNIVDELYYPQYEVQKFLKSVSPYISLHELYEVKGLKCDYKEIVEIINNK